MKYALTQQAFIEYFAFVRSSNAQNSRIYSSHRQKVTRSCVVLCYTKLRCTMLCVHVSVEKHVWRKLKICFPLVRSFPLQLSAYTTRRSACVLFVPFYPLCLVFSSFFCFHRSVYFCFHAILCFWCGVHAYVFVCMLLKCIEFGFWGRSFHLVFAWWKIVYSCRLFCALGWIFTNKHSKENRKISNCMSVHCKIFHW